MKIKFLLLMFIINITLTSCNKEVEQYESKNIQVDSVFNNEDNQSNESQDKKPEENSQKQAPKQNASPQNNKKKLKTVDPTNLRRNPTTNSEIVLSVPASVDLDVIEEVTSENEVWVKTKYNNSEGFIRKDLLEE